MDFMTLLTGMLETVETVMLLVTLYFLTAVIREKKKKDNTSNKAGYIKAVICLTIFLALKVVRLYCL
jgi:uncharacterized membrane protein